jgi:hypothetical protein
MESKKQAQGIAALGRYGDTTLMHMRPDEVEQLKAISRAGGGDITINPKTGMPEAFLGDFLGALAPFAAGIGANALLPGAGSAFAVNNPILYKYAIPAAAGIGAKAIVNGGDLSAMDVLSGGFGGYGGAQFGSSLSQFGAEAAKTPVTEQGLSGMSPVDTTQGINMSTGQTVGGTGQTFTPKTYPAGTGSNLGSGALRTQGGVGIPPSTPNQVYQAGPDRLYQPNMNQVNPYTYTKGVKDNLNMGGYDGVGGQGSSALYTKGGQGFNVDTVPAVQDSFKEGFNFGQSISDSKLGRGFQAAAKDPMGYLKSSEVGDGSALAGGIKTALPFATAAGETYMKGYYDDMPSYETSTAGLYDPNRRLNLGMDTGLRLLAQGGKVEKFAEGNVVRDRSYYGINPQYQTSYTSTMGIQGPSRQTRVPVMGFVDVGGKFVADPKGTMSDIDYEKRFKYVTEGVAKPEDQDSSFEAKAGLQGGAGTGINPAVALNLAQGYADTQQADTAETGLGGLKKGGAIKYQQGGQTTAEQNTAKAATPPPATSMDMLIAKKNEEEMAKQGIPAGINMEAIKQQAGMAEGGISELAQATPDDGKMLNGMGDGVSDDIPAMIEGEQEAALSDGEFIVPARIVSELGNGSSDAGAQKLYSMIDRIQAARKQTIGNDKQYAKDTNAERYLPA